MDKIFTPLEAKIAEMLSKRVSLCCCPKADHGPPEIECDQR